MKRTIAIPVATLAVALTFGAPACGDDGPGSVGESTAPVSTEGDTSVPATDDTETTDVTANTGATESSEPTDPTDTTAGEEPTVDSASDVVVGLIEDDAAAAAEDQGWELRVTRRDGEDLPVTMDLRPNRVNVEVVDGEVTEVLNIG